MLRCMLQFFPAPYSASLTGLCYLCSQATANRILVNDIPVFHCEFLPVLKFKWRFWALSVGVPLAVIIVYAIWFINKKIKKEPKFLTNPEKVICTLAEPHVVNLPVILTADTTNAGLGKLTASCSGKETGFVPVSTSSKSSIYTVSFTPQKQDNYTLAVYFSGEPVTNSPFNVTVLQQEKATTLKFDASKCVISELPLGCHLPVVNSDIHCSVDASRAGIADLIITADGPSGEVLSQFVAVEKAQEKSNFTIKYTPSVPGEHILHFTYGGDHIPGSPLRFIVASEYQVPAVIASACYVLPEDLPLSGNPCKFHISTVGAGHGTLTVATRGPGKAVAKIIDNENGIYSCELTMCVAGTYSVDIMWNGEQIPDSPYKFCFKQNPTLLPQACSIECSVTKSSVVNQLVILTADATKAGPGKLTASCFGKESGSISVCIGKDKSKSDIYSISFTPQQQDDYFLSVHFNGQPIPKSPFNIVVLPMVDPSPPTMPEKQFDASKCIITDLPIGCYLPVVNSDIHFSVDATQAGLAELVITSSGETLSQCVITEDTLRKGYFQVRYFPKVPGVHKLHLTYGGDSIPSSPLLFIVASAVTSHISMNAPASKCYVVSNNLPLTGNPCKFQISTSGAGCGALDITTCGPGKAEVKIFDKGNGIYSCELALTVPGTYNVDITWDGQQIQGSPYQLVSGEVETGLITGFDLESKHFQIGKPYRFKVQCNNLSQGEIFEVRAKPPSAAKVSVFSVGSSAYDVEIIPEEEGHHEVLVLYGDSHVAGSPFNVTFYHSIKSRVIKSGVEKKENGKDIAFFVVSTEGAGQGNLTATVKNCNDNDTPQVNIEDMDEAFTHRVSFPITRNTQYLLSIKCDNEHIKRSPFKLWFDPVANPNACRAYGNGLKISLAEKTASFTVNSSGAGPGEPKVTVTDQNRAVIESSLLKSGRNQYQCSYTPTKPGIYSIAIEWAGLPIPCSPFLMTCYLPPTHPSPFSITEQPQNSVAGEDIIFTVISSRDVKEQDNFIVFAESSTGTIDGKVTCGVFGAYCCTVTPVLAGTYTVRACWNGVDIKGSPFEAKVGLSPRPDLVKAYGPGLKNGFIGQEGNFTLETGEAGSGTLDVKVHGPKGAFKINMRHHPDNNRTILVRYDPKYTGEYNIDITWVGKHIPNSPFKVNIQKQLTKSSSV